MPRVLNTLKDNLQAKIENPAHPPTSYFARVQEFINIARKSSGGRYKKQIKSLTCFYGSSSLISHGKKSVKPIVNATSLEAQIDIFKNTKI